MTIEHLTGQDAQSDWASDPERSRLHWMQDTATGKRFFVLRQRGAFPDLCYDHGRLLGRWIGQGVFPEILDTVAVDTDLANDALDIVPSALFAKIVQDIDRASSGEVQDAIYRLYRGYSDSGSGDDVDMGQVRTACLAIDAGNIATGFTRRVERWGEDWPDEEIAYLRQALAAWPGVDPSLIKRSNFGLILSLMRRLFAGTPTMGCTGFWAAPGQTADGAGLHARTFDGAFFAWNNVPGAHLFDERASNGEWHRYAAVGTAGLIYPGGISGLNEAGIGCSLHQMSTTTYSTGSPGGGWDIAPFVQQRILREASSLDQAVAIARAAKHFAAWAIVVSDAKTGKAVTIEINGREDADGGQRVEVLDHGETAVQSNHFRTGPLAEIFDHFGDAHFTKSYGKWLETRARITATERRLGLLTQTGLLDTGEALQMLAGHEDAALPQLAAAYPARSFGRTVCKAYGLMASIVRAPADRGAAADELWLTLGDRLPGPHSAMAGFDIDWDGFALNHRSGTLAAQTLSPGQVTALGHYLSAHMAFVRPQGDHIGLGGDDYVGRKLTDHETALLLRVVIGHLDRAIDDWTGAIGEPDVPFHYIRARIAHALGTTDGSDSTPLYAAKRDWDLLTGLATSNAPSVPLHDYDRVLILIYAGATANALGDRDRGRELAAEGETIRARLTGGPGGGHPGLSSLSSLAWEVGENGASEDLPPIDFVTVE